MDATLKYAAAGRVHGCESDLGGRILSGLAIVFFVMDGAMKLVQPQAVIEATRQIGWPTDPMTLLALGPSCWPVPPCTPFRERRCWARSC